MKKRLALLLILTLGFVFLSGCGGSPASLTSTVPPVRTLNVGVSLSPGTAQGMDQGQQMSFTAAVVNDSNSKGVIWTVSGGGTLSNATAASVTYNAPTSGSSSVTVTLTATSVADSTKTASVLVTVAPPPSVLAPSAASLTGTTGIPYSLTLQASGGTAPFTWSLASGNLPAGLTLSSVGVISGTPTGSGTSSLIVQVKDSAASPVTATTALTLTVNAPPAITTQPANQTVTAGQTATFSATATGTAPLSYQWSKNGTAISGTNSSSYTTRATTAADSGATFAVAVSNIAGSVTSTPATLTVNIPPAITTQPANQTVIAGHAATFNVTATGTEPLTYQWSKNGIAISGANSSSYTMPATTMADSGSAFTVAVVNPFGNVTSNAAILTVKLPPTISKSFGAASIPLAGSTSLSFTVNNPNTTTLTGIAFSDALPAGLMISTPNGLAGSCGGGTVTATQATNVVSLSSASLAASGSCTFSVNVTGTVAGTQINTTGNVTSTEGGTGGTASASMAVVAPPLLAVTFNPASIALNATSSLTFTITNPAANTAALMGVAFSDTLPTGLTVVNSSATVCGGTLTAAAPTGISLLGATVAINSQCQFSVSVTGAVVGNYSNMVNGASTITSTNGGTGVASNTANLAVVAPPTISKVFDAFTIPLNGTTFLTFTINNPNSSVTLNGVAFTDSLPAGLVVATPANLNNSCGATATATDGSGSVSLTGASLAAGASCQVSVKVTGTTAGVINNSVTVSSTNGGTGNTSNASVTVVVPQSMITFFGAASIPLNGTTSLSFTISNPNTSATLTGIGFSDTLPAGLVISTPNGLTGACVRGTTTATQGTNLISLSGASVAASGSCTFSVNVTGTAAGTQINTTGNVTSTEGGSGGTASASIVVVAPTFQVSGNVSWLNGGGTVISGVTVSINTSPAQNTTTDNNGNFNFAAVPNGTYTIAPSITGPSSIFLPSSLQVTVNGANISNANFQGQLGYTVAGTANYGGTLTGRIYLQLQSTSNFCTTSGTSVAAAGDSFTIKGVCPGTYTLTAWMDNLGYGAQNASNPIGNVVVTVSTTDVLGQTVTLNDPAPVDISTSTTGFKGVFGTTNGAMAMIKPVTNNLGEETATSYTIQWSADSTFNTGVNSHTFGAIGEGGNGGDKPYILSATNGLTGLSGSTLYFRIQAANATSQTIWTNYASNPVTIGAPTGANTISGTVSFADTATGPMYVGCFDQNTSIIYATVTDTPMSPQAYSVSGVPTGANCFIFGIVDQNSDGIIDAGDISNTDSGGNSGVTISGNLTQNITLPSTNATATVTTHHSRTAGQSGDWYALNFDVRGSIRMPVALELTAGPNVLVPVDVAKNSSKGFDFWPNLGGVRPTLGDTYNLGVVYSDNLPETLQPAVTGVSDAFAQNMSVTGGTTPTFNWSAPTNPPASYTYQFWINDNNGNQIWHVPGNNSNSSGLSSSVTSLTWNSDPTDLNNHPTVPNLSIGVTYQWTITVTDRDGNSAQMQQSYTP